RGAVADHTLEGLRALDVVSWHARRPGAESTTTTAPPAAYGGAGEQVLTLADLLAIATAADRPLRLAVELKHPSPFGHELEERVLRELLRAGWDSETGRVGQV
ncbi:glycerophosphodiester phosphodiesterase, partial [Xanthomonas citri pv. citri]|nr:glycerophosphodiester phosphodiesterase [Xanthomonas citri pv. citri]